jgi:hypothetical protein
MTEPDAITPANRHINLTYGTALAVVVLMLSLLVVGGWFIYSLRSELDGFKGVNACRAQVAEDERKATLDVTVGQGEIFITGVLNKDNLVQVVTNYRATVNDAEKIAGQDINEVCK